MKRYNNLVQRGEVKQYFNYEKLYFIVYDNGENEKISFRQLVQYTCIDTDRDTTRQNTRLSTRLQRGNIVKAMKNKSSPADRKLPAHFSIAVYNEETGKMIDYKKLIGHPNKEMREWWQNPSANECKMLLKGVGRNDYGT